MAPGKSRDADCCSVNFLKYVLQIFNVVFLMAGGAVLGVGVWTLACRHWHIALLSTVTYAVAAGVLVTAGVLAVLGAVVGCFSVWRENRCLLLAYTFLLLLIFLLEAMVGVISYVYQEQVYKELEMNLNTTFVETYYVDPTKTAAIDHIQQQFRCCGAIRFEDWEYSQWYRSNASSVNKVPDSCCKTISPGCGRRNHPSNIHYSGCIYRLSDEIEDQLIILGAVGLGICVLQIFGMVFSCCLYIKLKDVIDW